MPLLCGCKTRLQDTLPPLQRSVGGVQNADRRRASRLAVFRIYLVGFLLVKFALTFGWFGFWFGLFLVWFVFGWFVFAWFVFGWFVFAWFVFGWFVFARFGWFLLVKLWLIDFMGVSDVVFLVFCCSFVVLLGDGFFSCVFLCGFLLC